MKQLLTTLALVIATSMAGQRNTPFEQGFKDGYCKAHKEKEGKYAICPLPPLAPLPEFDKKTYEDGFIRGMREYTYGNQSSPVNSGVVDAARRVSESKSYNNLGESFSTGYQKTKSSSSSGFASGVAREFVAPPALKRGVKIGKNELTSTEIDLKYLQFIKFSGNSNAKFFKKKSRRIYDYARRLGIFPIEENQFLPSDANVSNTLVVFVYRSTVKGNDEEITVLIKNLNDTIVFAAVYDNLPEYEFILDIQNFLN